MTEPQSASTLVDEALAFARERLGHASEAAVRGAESQTRVLARLRAGLDMEDAVLAEVHRAARDERRVADEFVGYFLGDLMRLGGTQLSPRLRRFLDTGDLVQSVLGDLWSELRDVRFETRARFLSFLMQRMDWKAAGKARELAAGKRREDLRAGLDPSELDPAAQGSSPSSALERQEERDALILRLMRLSERDRELLLRHLRGESVDTIARALELSHDATVKALQRAKRRARELS